MLDSSRNDIREARKNLKDKTIVKKAENSIIFEMSRVLFSELIHVLSDFWKKPVILIDLTELPKYTDAICGDLFRNFDTKGTALQRPPLTPAQKVEYIKLKLKKKITHPWQGMRYVFRELNTIVICVYKLEPDWLSLNADGDSGLKNADFIHMAIAHEVMGELLGTDSLFLDNLKAVTKEDERHTHALAGCQVISHWVRHRVYHQVARFYASTDKRAGILSALYTAEWDIAHEKKGAPIPLDDFQKSIVAHFDQVSTRTKQNMLRSCPYKWDGLLCHIQGDGITEDERRHAPRKVIVAGGDTTRCPEKDTCPFASK